MIAGRPLIAISAAIALAGCLHRADYAPPVMPAPLAPPLRGADLPLPSAPLTAVDAVRLARARNPALTAAAARMAQARAGLDATTAAFLPRVSADLAYLHGDAPSAYLFKRIDARRLPAQVDFNDPGSFSNIEGGLGLQWNVWNNGRDLLARWSAQTAATTAALARDAAVNTVAAAVVGTFFDARAATELRAADDAAVRTVEAQVEDSRIKVRGGGALRADLLSLEVRLAETRQQRFHSETAERLALATLRELLALPLDTPITLAASPYTAAPLPATAAEALAEAYHHRPEAGLARRAVERARLELAAARRAYWPRVDLLSRFYADVPSLHITPEDPNYTVAVALSVDLFDGGTRTAAIHRARAVLDELTESDREALHTIAREVETAYLRLGEARSRSEVAAQAVGAAEESLDLVEVQYRGGAAPVTRYLEAESARTRARTARIQAQLDLERAIVEVERALGRLAEPAPAEGDGA